MKSKETERVERSPKRRDFRECFQRVTPLKGPRKAQILRKRRDSGPQTGCKESPIRGTTTPGVKQRVSIIVAREAEQGKLILSSPSGGFFLGLGGVFFWGGGGLTKHCNVRVPSPMLKGPWFWKQRRRQTTHIDDGESKRGREIEKQTTPSPD